MKHRITIRVADYYVNCLLQFQDTILYFENHKEDYEQNFISAIVSDDDWKFYTENGMKKCAHTEYSMLSVKVSEALMPVDCMLFHAVAIRWKDHAYLISGKSGVGKSTQARFLQEICPGEFSVICGDRPALQFLNAGRDEVIVHPSPWNGKENWHGAEAAKLAGIIFLDRGFENKLCTLTPRQAAVRAFSQVLQTSVYSEMIDKAAALCTRLLNAVPIWNLTSYQVPESTKLLVGSVFCTGELEE